MPRTSIYWILILPSNGSMTTFVIFRDFLHFFPREYFFRETAVFKMNSSDIFFAPDSNSSHGSISQTFNSPKPTQEPVRKKVRFNDDIKIIPYSVDESVFKLNTVPSQ